MAEATRTGVRRLGNASTADDYSVGLHEERYATVIADPAGLPEEWPHVAAVVQVNRERACGGKTTSIMHYYVTSHLGTAAGLAALVRGHWGIESMHWVLDVVYGEDDHRARAGHAGRIWRWYGRRRSP